MFRTTSLQEIGDIDLDELVLRRYEIIYRQFFAERSLIPQGHYCELHFETLEADPIRALKHIYDELGLGGFEKARPHFTCHLTTINGYQKNHFRFLTDTMQDEITRRWHASFDEWGYERKVNHAC